MRHLAASGIRLVIAELRSDVTKTRKDGTRGRLRIDYGDPRQPDAALKWLWRYVDGAKTAGELYGRALVIIARAARQPPRAPASQRAHSTSWSSHKDLAAKALRKLAGPHLPATLKALEQAIKRAHTAHAQAEQAQRARPRATTRTTPPVGDGAETSDAQPRGDDVRETENAVQ